MELWIRSQDRMKLLKCENLVIESTCSEMESVGEYCIYNSFEEIAKYKTKERALEVLDEIQQYLTPKIELLDEKLNGKQVCQIGNILTMVYEMPKE